MLDLLLARAREKNWPECERLLYEHWSRTSADVFAPNIDEPWDAKPDDSKINDSLLQPIASAYCLDETVGTDLTPLMSLCGLNSNACIKGSICGRVFRTGEATYSCRECANDGTCVLCYECFNKSAHRYHKYRVSTSSGAGYCDCGDIEAWKNYPACDLHIDALETNKDKSDSELLPKEVNDRVHALTRSILRYSTSMICWLQTDQLPDVLKKQEPYAAPYQTILFNDETHTYDSVIRALNLSIHCNEQQAMLLATIVDHEGRTSVRSGSAEFCARAKEEIQRRTQKDSNRRTEKSGPLEVRVIDSRLVAVQSFSLRLLSWLTSQIRNFPPLGSVIGNVLLNERLDELDDAMECEDAPERDTVVVHVMKYDRALWKAARAHFHQMFMATVLMHFEQKQEFTRHLVRNYKKIFLDFIEDDHEHSVSITSLTVQVFTVPTLARMLIAEESAIKVLLGVLVDYCRKYLKEPDKKRFDFSGKSFPNVLRRAMFIMNDFKYLLTSVPSPNDWTSQLEDSFCDGCIAFIQFLSFLQGMDDVKRQSGEHQTWELEWETAFNIHLRTEPTLTMVIAWICSHKDVHSRLFGHLLEQLCSVVKDCEGFSNKVKVEVNGISAMCIPFDVMRDRISIHQPLWRLMAGLFAAPSEFVQNAISQYAQQNKSGQGLEGNRAMLYEMPMRVFVLCAQCQAQMWRRNGFSLVNQIHNYFSALCRSEMYDRDVLMMQVGAAVSPPDVFLIRLLHRFSLHNWAEFGFEEQKSAAPPQSTSPEELSKSTVTLAEEMLHLVISIIEERYVPGVGESTLEEALRREVLHVLATGPKPFSKIDRAIPDCPLLADISLEAVVKSICDFKKPTKANAGMFSLKKSVWNEYSPFFYHYSKTDISQAEQYQVKTRAGCEKSLSACPPPKAPSFEPFFAPIRNILLCPVLIRIVRVVLERSAKRSRYSSDGLLHRVLYIIGLGLNEQTEDKEFDFIAEIEKENVLELLEKLDGKIESSLNADLLVYLVQKCQSLKTATVNSTPMEKEEKDVGSDTARKAKRAAMAAKMRKQAMDQMSRMQKQFLASNKHSLEIDGKNVEDPSTSTATRIGDDEEPLGFLPEESGFPVCLGSDRTDAEVVHCRRLTCILCQELEEVKYNGKPLVCVAFIQQSSLFAQKSSAVRCFPEYFIAASVSVGISASTCGHTMHFDCYQHYSELLKARERGRPRQALAMNQRLIDVEAGEYLCPLCKRLSNTAIPLLQALSFLDVKRFDVFDNLIGDFEKWTNLFDADAPVNEHAATAKGVKTHSRKRSHSERFASSLVPLRDGEESFAVNDLSSSVPSGSAHASPLSGEILGDLMDVDDASNSTENNGEQNEGPFRALFHKLGGIIRTEKKSQDNVPNSLKSWEMIKCFLQTAYSIKKPSEGEPNMENQNEMEMLTAWQMTAFTLRSISVALRREDKPLFGALNARQRECLFALSRISAVAAFNCRPEHLKSLLKRLMEPLLGPQKSSTASISLLSTTESSPSVSNSSRSLPSSPSPSSSATSSSKLFNLFWSGSSTSSGVHLPVTVCDLDMLTLAFELAMSIGWSFTDEKLALRDSDCDMHWLPNGSQQEHFALRLTLLGHIFQIFATFDLDDPNMVSNYNTTWTETRADFDDILMSLLRVVRGADFLCDLNILRQALFVGIVEFLRPLALLFYALTLIPPPEALKAPSYDEFQPLCRYLGFPSEICELLNEGYVERLFARWAGQHSDNLRLYNYIQAQEDGAPLTILVRQPIMENSLITLPDDFSELINTAANFRCPTSLLEDHVSTMPTLCLICGSLLCSQSYCCQRVINKETKGACSFHLQSCSGPSGGIFLRVRDCQVILLTSRSRGCFLPAPYVDEFGETDFGFRRGNPMHLNKEMYAKLERIWLHQSINEDVVNQNEVDSRNRFEWQHF